MQCPNCKLEYSPEEWEMYNYGNGRCIYCCMNTTCDEACMPSHSRHVRGGTLDYYCAQRNHRYRWCTECERFIRRSNEFEQTWDGYWVCDRLEHGYVLCGSCELAVERNAGTLLIDRSFLCPNCSVYPSPPNDQPPTTKPFYRICRTCYTKAQNIHLLTEKRLCKCATEKARQNHEPVLYYSNETQGQQTEMSN